MKALAAVAALACCVIGCGSHPVPPDMTTCIPSGTLAIAGIDLDRLHAAPLYPKLPAAVLAFADTYRAAHRLLIAWNGDDLLIVARGSAPGATTVAPDLAVAGSAASVRAALAQYHTGKSGSPVLADAAARTVASSQLWAVAQGGVTLPVTGNARNLNRLFRNLNYAALSADLTDSLELHITARARTDEAAREFDENLRAILSLASAAETRNPQIASLLASIQIQRAALKTDATLTVPPPTAESFLKLLTPAF
jgi:hypothetical protein